MKVNKPVMVAAERCSDEGRDVFSPVGHDRQKQKDCPGSVDYSNVQTVLVTL